MAYIHAKVTLSGAVQNLAAVISNSFGVPLENVRQIPLRTLILQPDGANADPIYVGSHELTGTDDYGFRLEGAAVPGIPQAPFVLGEHDIGGPMKLKDFWVLGTLNEILRVSWVPF